MTETIGVRIEGDPTGAVAAARVSSTSIADASALIKAKLAEASESARAAFQSIGQNALKASGAAQQASEAIRTSSDKLNQTMVTNIGLENNLAIARARGDQVATRAAENNLAFARSYDKFTKAGYESADATRLATEHIDRLTVAQREGEKTTTRLGGAFGRLRTLVSGALAVLSVGMFVRLGDESLEYAGGLAEVAQQLGVSTDALQEYRYIGTQVGVSQNQMDEGLGRLTKSLGMAQAGNKKTGAAFKELSDILGKDVAPAGATVDTVLYNLVGAFSKIEDPAKRAALETIIFGKAGQKLDTLLAGGVNQVDNLRDAAHRLGIVLSEDQIAHADDTADKLSSVQTVLKANIAGAVANNAQAIIGLANALSTVVVWAGKAASALHYFYIQSAINSAQERVNLADNTANGWFTSKKAREQAMRDGIAAREEISELRGQQINDITAVRGAPPKPSDAPWAQASIASIDARGKPKQGAGGEIGAGASGGGGSSRSKGGGDSASIVDQWRTDLADMLAAEQNWGLDETALSLKFWQQKLALHQAKSKEQLGIEREISRLKMAAHRDEQQEQIAVIRAQQEREEDAAQTEIALAQEVAKAKLDVIDRQEQAEQISSVQAVRMRAQVNRELRQLDIESENRAYAAKVKAMADQQKLYRLGTREYQQFTRDLETAEQQHQNRLKIMRAKAKVEEAREEAEEKQKRRQRYEDMASGYGQALARMATFQQGFGTTLGQIWDNMLGNFTNMLGRMITQWLLSLVLKEAMSKTFNAKQILMDAKAAAAAAFKAIVGIPFVGPVLAPIAAAAAFAGVMAFSAKDGYDVPAAIGPGIDGRGGQLGVVHPREMVLPADIAENFRRGGGGGGDTFVIKTLDARSFKQWARANKGDFVDTVKSAYRDGKR